MGNTAKIVHRVQRCLYIDTLKGTKRLDYGKVLLQLPSETKKTYLGNRDGVS